MGMDMISKCLIEAGFPDADAVKAAMKALAHEGASGRSSATLNCNGKTLSIAIEAKDVVALRAAANAYLRALAVFESVERGADDE
jgi:tRNA threonylcarbamoyladenosine modification (KEOPS) complex  Pcc1 subunit